MDETRHEGYVLLEPDRRARPHLREREQLALLREVNPLQGIGVALRAHDPRLPVDRPALRTLRRREPRLPEVLEERVDAGELRCLERVEVEGERERELTRRGLLSRHRPR